MFDNPQQEVKNMSKKLRPIKLSDEAFELFYKEIYAEFGPKDVPPVELNPKVEVQAEAENTFEEPAETVAVFEEPEAPTVEIVEEPVEEVEEESAAPEANTTLREEIAQAAAMIRDVQDDEIIDDDTDGITLVAPKKEKGIGGLVLTICLELLAIAGIAAYWLFYLL